MRTCPKFLTGSTGEVPNAARKGRRALQGQRNPHLSERVWYARKVDSTHQCRAWYLIAV